MQTVFLGYAQTIVTAALVGMIGILIRSVFNKAESMVAAHVAPDVATKVNNILDTVERLAESVVQDFNSRIVIGLKQNNLFTKKTADSVKEAAVKSVVENLGPLKDEAVSLIGPIEGIVGQMVEKYVLKGKDQVNQIVGITPIQPSKTQEVVVDTPVIQTPPTAEHQQVAQVVAESIQQAQMLQPTGAQPLPTAQ